ncbi:MAG: SIR2 family protein [Campylobacterales bacterium]|nr:SIR2 family protein [Campylobacterales bacterium]
MEEELKRLISENKVIPFVGAGVSKDVKDKDNKTIFLTWKELLENFVEIMPTEKKKNVIRALLDDEPVNYLEVADKIEDALDKSKFNDTLKNSFNVDYNNIDTETLALAQSIWNLDSKLVITTNYDKVLFHSCNDKNIELWNIESVHEQAKYLKDGLLKPVVWNLHGDISEVESIILSSKKYSEFYTENVKDSKYKTALETFRNILSTKRLLFIGFSLDDKYIVNQIIRTLEIFNGSSTEHYFLSKKSSSKPNLLNNKIKVIEYENHGQDLINKIKSLAPISTNNENKIEEKIPTQTIYSSTQHQSNFLTVLPEVKNDFIGRVDELAKIKEMLSNDNISCIVNGIGGVGKSELALKYFHDNKHNYNNVAFIQLTQDTTSIENVFFQAFKDRLNLQPETSFNNILLQLQGLKPKNLILIDNLEKKEDFDKIKCLNTKFDVLLATRLQNIESKYQINLETLNDTDAKELFLRTYNKDENIEDVLKYLDNHPLFITLLASSLKSKYITFEELRENIKNKTIPKIDSKDDKTFKEHLIDTFERQFVKETNEDLKTLLQILSIFPSMEIKFEIFEKILIVNNLKVKLQKLVERGWLIQNDSSYKLHQIIKTFLQEEHKVEYENISYILQNIANYINPDDSTLIANQLNDYIPIIDELLEKYENKKDEYICGILDSQTYLYYSLGLYNYSLVYQTKAYDFKLERYGENSIEFAKSNNLLGILFKVKAEYPKALEHYKKTLKIRKEQLGENHSNTALSYANLAGI